MQKHISALLPGLSLCLLSSLLATWLSEIFNLPVLLLALIAGLLLHYIFFRPSLKTGISFSSNQILKLGVALIGLQVTLNDLATIGWHTAIFLLFVVFSTLLFGIGLSKIFKQSSNFGYLSGSAVAICGGSAALAVSSILPQNETLERDTAVCIIGITILSSIAMLIYPFIVTWLEFDVLASSVFLGGSIHNFAQVVGAAFTVSDEVGEFSSLIKLLRVALLVPCILLILVNLQKTTDKNLKKAPVLPLFLIAQRAKCFQNFS